MFRVSLVGTWAQELWTETGDTVRVIGTFTKANGFQLLIDDNQPESADQMQEFRQTKAQMIIVEPLILIPTT